MHANQKTIKTISACIQSLSLQVFAQLQVEGGQLVTLVPSETRSVDSNARLDQDQRLGTVHSRSRSRLVEAKQQGLGAGRVVNVVQARADK